MTDGEGNRGHSLPYINHKDISLNHNHNYNKINQ